VVSVFPGNTSTVAYPGPELPDKAMFQQESIPQDFLEQLYECTSMFKNLQVSAYVISNLYILVLVKSVLLSIKL
jgi:hypothetical protein